MESWHINGLLAGLTIPGCAVNNDDDDEHFNNGDDNGDMLMAMLIIEADVDESLAL